MQLEEAFVVDTTQVADYVDSKEDLLIQIVRTHQHNINSTMLQTAKRLKRELQRGTRQIKENTAGKKKMARKDHGWTIPT
jgi:riboflavin synthase